MPAEGIKKKQHLDIISYEQIVSIVKEAAKIGITKVRLTGGEPLVRKGIADLVAELKKISQLKEITLTTNGQLLEALGMDLKEAGLDRINVSLDTLNPEKYRQLTRIGNVDRVLAGLHYINKIGFKHTKINMVVIPGVNTEDIDHLNNFCQKNGYRLQRIHHYTLDNLSSIDHSFHAERPLPCRLCNRIRLTADGKLKPCLFSDLEIPVDFNSIQESLRAAVSAKPEHGTHCHTSGIWQIGG
jgi:cyclic pyranopterin phosphate synthase